MKVIFLDIEGVLTCDKSCIKSYFLNTYFPSKYHTTLDERKVKLLGKICEYTNAKIVLTSTWRCSYLDLLKNKSDIPIPNDVYELERLFNKYNIEIIDIVPVIYGENGSEDRILEILYYLKNHPEIESFCAIDDDIDSLNEYTDHLVKTNSCDDKFGNGGIMKKHYEPIIKLLNKK